MLIFSIFNHPRSFMIFSFSFWYFSIVVSCDFQVSFNLKVILYVLGKKPSKYRDWAPPPAPKKKKKKESSLTVHHSNSFILIFWKSFMANFTCPWASEGQNPPAWQENLEALPAIQHNFLCTMITLKNLQQPLNKFPDFDKVIRISLARQDCFSLT